jgi:hypothetical protein
MDEASAEAQPAEKPRIWLDRRRASAYIVAKYAARVSAATLAKLAVSGSGPPFAYQGRYAVYEPEDLDVWALSRLSEKVHATSGRPRDPFRRRGRPKSPFVKEGSAERLPKRGRPSAPSEESANVASPTRRAVTREETPFDH